MRHCAPLLGGGAWPHPEGRYVLTNQRPSVCRVLAPRQLPAVPPGIPEAAPWLLRRRAVGRAGRWPEKLQPPPSGSGAVTAPPSHRPRAQKAGSKRGGGGLGRGSEGLDPPQDAEGHADQTTQPLPRGGPSPHWLEVDKDWKTCKMATGSQAGHESRSGAPVRPTPTPGAAPAQPQAQVPPTHAA